MASSSCNNTTFQSSWYWNSGLGLGNSCLVEEFKKPLVQFGIAQIRVEATAI